MGFVTFGASMDPATLMGEAAAKVEVIAELAELGSRTGKLGVKKGRCRLKRRGSQACGSRRVAAYTLTLRTHRSKMVETTTGKKLTRYLLD